MRSERCERPDECYKDVEAVHPVPPDVRRGFVRRVYALLAVQLALTFGACLAALARPTAFAWLRQSSLPLVFLMLGLPLVCLIQHFKHRHPFNVVLLLFFTALQSFALAAICAGGDADTRRAILVALGTTLVVFVGLSARAAAVATPATAAAAQEPLFAALIALLVGGALQAWLQLAALQFLLALLGVVCFCGYVVHDTALLVHVLGPDDAIEGALMLYLDVVNLFVYMVQCAQLGGE